MTIAKLSFINIIFVIVGFISTAKSSTFYMEAAKNNATPPQLISISFDGSKSIGMWDSTIKMAKETHSHFTYFVSGVYFLNRGNKHLYQGPHRKVGASDIGFGADSDDLKNRVLRVQSAVNSGNDIGSHVNGHFDGAKWDYEDWKSEFSQFHKFIEEVFSLNNLDTISGIDESSWATQIRNLIKGFRAPLLAINGNSDKLLKDFNYTYDASRTADMGKWPYKLSNTGVWQFPLGFIPIAGTAKKSIAMDFNFYYFDSKGIDDPIHSESYLNRYYDSLMNYFNKSYNGNRAPLNIGNHFSQWNGGAYYKALEKFVNTVCADEKYPDVRCVKYADLVEEMDTMNDQYPHVLAQWKQKKERSFGMNPLSETLYYPSKVNIYDLELDSISVNHERSEIVFEMKGKSASQFYQGLIPNDQGLKNSTMNLKVWLLNPFKKEKLKVSLPQNKSEILVSRPLELHMRKINHNAIVGTFDYLKIIRDLGLRDGNYTFCLSLNDGQKSKKIEIQTATRDVRIESGYITEIESENQENKARSAELPGAHTVEEE